MSDLRAAIAGVLHKACEKLGADMHLLGIIGSYGDTLGDRSVLTMLRHYNLTGQAIKPDDRSANVVDFPTKTDDPKRT